MQRATARRGLGGGRWLAAFTRPETRHGLTLIGSNLESDECKPLRLDATAGHFLGIGVPSAQRSGGTVSGHLRLKYRTCHHLEEQMP
jgi:hypothetical protein